MDLNPGGSGRMVIALIAFGLLAAGAWSTMEPGKYRDLCLILLGFFAFRVLLGRARSGRN